jgi:tetratricopeptide (TPR) repeat protein
MDYHMQNYRTILLIVTIGFGTAASAFAQADVDQARIQFQLGIELYDQGRFEQAAIAFARAYELRPSYKILYNLAQVENDLGHYAAALSAYSRYLSEGRRDIEQSRREQIEGEIKRLGSLVGSISVECPIEKATVMLDGEVVGYTPLSDPLFVALGKHEVEITRKGARLYRQVLKVSGGQTVSVKVEVGNGLDEWDPAEGKKDLGPIPFWIAIGVTGAAGIATGAMELAVQGAIDDVESDPANRNAADRGKSLQTAERVLLGVTGAAAVTAVILFFFTEFKRKSHKSAETHLVFAPVAGEDGFVAGLSGRF